MGDGASSSCLESSSVASLASANAGQITTDHSTISGVNSVNVPNGLLDIIPQLAVWVISGVDVRAATFLVTATDLVLSSWRDKSTKSYDSSIEKWACWCDERDKNPISDPISDVANFLGELFEDGYQYQSIKACHLAIS